MDWKIYRLKFDGSGQWYLMAASASRISNTTRDRI